MLAAIERAIEAVVDVPALVEGDFGFVVASGDGGGEELVTAVAIGVLQQRTQTIGLPIARAADFILEIAGHIGDEAVDAVADPAGFVVVPEGDGAIFGHFQRDVGAVIFGVEAVVVFPGSVEGGFVFVAAGGEVEDGRPQIIVGDRRRVGFRRSRCSSCQSSPVRFARFRRW